MSYHKGKGDARDLQPRVDPFVLEPSLFLWARSRVPPLPARRLLMLVPLGLSVLVVVAALEGNVIRSGVALSAGLQDLWSLASRAVPSGNPVYPLTRDLPTLLAIVGALVTPALVYRQWAHFDELLNHVAPNRVLLSFPDAGVGAQFEKSLANLGVRLAGAGSWAPARMAISFILAIALLRAARSGGIYNAFYPAGQTHLTRKEWRAAAYDGWWLNFDTATLAAIVFTAVTAVYIYYLLLQNELSLRVLTLFLPYRRNFIAGFDISRPHEDFGWVSLKRVITLAVVCLVIDGLLLYYLLLITPRALFAWLLPLTVMYAGTIPAFMVAPQWLFYSSRKRAKADAINAMRDQMVGASEVKQARLLSQINEIQTAVPNTFINLRSIFIGVIPAILAVVSFILVVWEVVL